MIRLTNDDSDPRVGDSSERHVHICARIKNGAKYANLIKAFYDDFEDKKGIYIDASKNATFAGDAIKLNISILEDVVRDVNGRAKEFDRNNPGANLTSLLFPEGLTKIMEMTDVDKPVEAHSISLKITSLGPTHILFPYKAQIETAITACNDAFDEFETAENAQKDADTAKEISKVKLINQYNTNFHIAATDYGKAYAEKLYPKIRVVKKTTSTT